MALTCDVVNSLNAYSVQWQEVFFRVGVFLLFVHYITIKLCEWGHPTTPLYHISTLDAIAVMYQTGTYDGRYQSYACLQVLYYIQFMCSLIAEIITYSVVCTFPVLNEANLQFVL